MSSTDAAQLSSIDSGLDDMVARVQEIRNRRIAVDEDDQLASDLLEVERLLTNSSRHLTRILRRL